MRVAIVGAAGKMGSWVAAFLHKQGDELVLVGRRREPLERLAQSLSRAAVGEYPDVRCADLVVVSVPLNAVDEVLRHLGAHVRPSQAVIDLSSVKTAPQRAAEAYMPQACFLGVHPMFGAGAESWAGHNVILTPAREDSAVLASRVRTYLEPHGAHVVNMDPVTHDEVMSVVLGLPALVVAMVARTALASGRFALAREVSGTSLEVLVSLTESMLCEGSELYGTLLSGLPDAPGVAEGLTQSAAHFSRLVAQGDREALIREFSALGEELEQLDHRAVNAYARMYAMLEALKRFPANAAARATEADPPPRAAC